MSDEIMERLAGWVAEARTRGAWQVCLVPDEPPVYRSQPRQGRSEIARAETDVLTAAETRQIAEAIFGPDRLGQLGRQVGTLEARVKLGDGTYASVTAALAAGSVTLIVRPVRSIGLDPRQIRIPDDVISAVESPNGLFIVTGPPGSGKTTTAYALLDHLNATRPVHIVTVGYHLEYVLEPKRAIVQERQIGVDVPDMLAGIQSAVLQGADVLFVAEIRDLEVFNACLRVAAMDCLVIVQLHAATPGGAVRRMLSLQPEDLRPGIARDLAGCLRAVLAQCLLPATQGRQVPAYGALLPTKEAREAILNGAPALDDLCRPGLESEIAMLRERGEVSPAAAEDALHRFAMARGG